MFQYQQIQFNSILYAVGAVTSTGDSDTNLSNDIGRLGYGSATTINGSGNPFSSQQDNYITVFRGTLNIQTTGTYTFAVDGDDAALGLEAKDVHRDVGLTSRP